MDPEFRAMEAELHNLVPAVGELNADRSDLPYGEVPGEPRAYGACDFEVVDGVVEPAIRTRGELTRIYLAMDLWYDIGLTPEGAGSVCDVSAADPPTCGKRSGIRGSGPWRVRTIPSCSPLEARYSGSRRRPWVRLPHQK